jgi:hypothetical protein
MGDKQTGLACLSPDMFGRVFRFMTYFIVNMNLERIAMNLRSYSNTIIEKKNMVMKILIAKKKIVLPYVNIS